MALGSVWKGPWLRRAMLSLRPADARNRSLKGGRPRLSRDSHTSSGRASPSPASPRGLSKQSLVPRARIPVDARYRAVFVAAFVLLLGGSPAQAAGPYDVATLHEDRPTWEGFGVGTMVQYRVTTTRGTDGGSVDSQSTEVKETLLKITDTAFEISKAHKATKDWSPATTYSLPRRTTAPKRKLDEGGTEKIRVDGKDYDCRKLLVTTTTPGADGEPSVETATLWEHAEHGILKSEFKRERTTTILVTKLSVRRRIGSRELSCRAFRVESGRQSGTWLLCPDVPGRLVESRLKFEAGGSRRIEKVLVAFEKK